MPQSTGTVIDFVLLAKESNDPSVRFKLDLQSGENVTFVLPKNNNSMIDLQVAQVLIASSTQVKVTGRYDDDDVLDNETSS